MIPDIEANPTVLIPAAVYRQYKTACTGCLFVRRKQYSKPTDDGLEHYYTCGFFEAFNWPRMHWSKNTNTIPISNSQVEGPWDESGPFIPCPQAKYERVK